MLVWVTRGVAIVVEIFGTLPVPLHLKVTRAAAVIVAIEDLF
jgi:hypothetical protein